MQVWERGDGKGDIEGELVRSDSGRMLGRVILNMRVCVFKVVAHSPESAALASPIGCRC